MLSSRMFPDLWMVHLCKSDRYLAESMDLSWNILSNECIRQIANHSVRFHVAVLHARRIKLPVNLSVPKRPMFDVF